MKKSILFTPASIGPLTLRNRTIRSAAFESMCPGNAPSEQLLNYHRSVAAGGVGMTTVAYAAVTRSGLSFDRQLWMRKEIIPGLRKVTDAIHQEGAAASIQLGHCGNMSHKKICGETPVGACSGFNLYSPTFVRGLRKDELHQLAKAYGDAVRLSKEAGFDAVEIHAGHGYLISQFLSPYTNHRKDEYGGTLENRMRFIIRKTKCFDFWERNVLFPKTKRSFFRTPKHPLPCPFPLNFSLLIITKKFGNLAKNRYICIV